MPEIITKNSKGALLNQSEGDDQIAASTRYQTVALSLDETNNRETLECDGTFAVTLPDAAALQTALNTSLGFGKIGFTVAVANTGAGTITLDLATAGNKLGGTVGGTLELLPGDAYTLVLETNGGTATGYFTLSVENAKIASTTLTFNSVPGNGGSSADQVWTHGLGTDDVDFGMSIGTPTLAAENSLSAIMRGVDRRYKLELNSFGTAPVSITTPASGTIRARVTNDYTSAVDILLHVWARER